MAEINGTCDVRKNESQREEWAAREALVAWEGFWQSVDGHWVNRPEANARASCKPLQLQEARRLGLTVPPTLITNEISTVRDFQKRYGRIVCKPLHDGAVPSSSGEVLLYTQRVDGGVLDRIQRLGPEPYFFQGLVDKSADIRVTIIGDQIFACRIESQATAETSVDWRQGSGGELDHEAHDLDDVTSHQLLHLARKFGLRFAAIDLALGEDGEYTFFEINPNGQWAWIEQMTEQPIAAALADELARER